MSTGDRLGLVRSAQVHAFSANQLMMAYPPDPSLGHLSYSHGGPVEKLGLGPVSPCVRVRASVTVRVSASVTKHAG